MKNLKTIGFVTMALAGGLTTGVQGHGTLSDPPEGRLRTAE